MNDVLKTPLMKVAIGCWIVCAFVLYLNIFGVMPASGCLPFNTHDPTCLNHEGELTIFPAINY